MAIDGIDLAAYGFKRDESACIAELSRNGTDYVSVTSDTIHYSFGYYSNNPWVSDDIIILSRSADIKNFHNCMLSAADFSSGAVYDLGITVNDFSEFVVYNELLYYISGKTLSRRNLVTGEDSAMLTCENGIGFPHITNDGRYINFESKREGVCCGVVFDTVTGDVTELFRKNFSTPFNISNHMMICPTDPNKMFFAHEGTTQYITNRLWLAESGKSPRCILRQKLTGNYDLGDCVGHECWSHDGKGLWYVKYAVSPTPPKGICYVLTSGDDSVRVLYSKYPYWHVSCSPDGRYVASDTQGGPLSGVCLIDTLSGEEKLLLSAKINWTHPCHPHPCFSPGSRCLSFHELSDGGMISVGMIRI